MAKQKRGKQVNDLTGMVFGKLKAVSLSHVIPGRGAYWLCRCECGREKIVFAQSLRNGDTSSCGCAQTDRKRIALFGNSDLTGMRFGSLTVLGRKNNRTWFCRCDCGREMTRDAARLHGPSTPKCKYCKAADRRMDLTGKKFGRLTAIEIDKDKNERKRVYWQCKCDCGNFVSVISSQLTLGKCRSCGCLTREISSETGATFGKENALGNRKYSWHVKVNGRRLTLRSSFEVIFAKYLLKHRIRFEYEPRRFQLAPDTIYIPDFYLPDSDIWVEVKGYPGPTWSNKRTLFERAGYKLLVVTEASLASYLPDISYQTWMKRNAHKYLRKP